MCPLPISAVTCTYLNTVISWCDVSCVTVCSRLQFPAVRRPLAAGAAARSTKLCDQPAVNARQLYYAVVHGAIHQRQASDGAQPADAGTQVVRGHGVPPVQPADARRRVQLAAAGRTAAARGVRSPARTARPANHGQRGQHGQHCVQHRRRRRAAGHARE